MKFAEIILQEIGDTTDAFDWRLTYDSKTQKVYKFSTPENNYEISVDSYPEWIALHFSIEGAEFNDKFSITTDEGEQFRVVATVLEIAEHAWNNRHTMMDGDTVNGFLISTDHDPRRLRLYKAFIKTQFPNAEMKSSNDTIRVIPT